MCACITGLFAAIDNWIDLDFQIIAVTHVRTVSSLGVRVRLDYRITRIFGAIDLPPFRRDDHE